MSHRKHRGKGGFESVLQELRDDFVRSPGAHTARPLQEFDKMLLGMFTTMNQGFDDFEPVKNAGLGHRPTFVRDFLCRFDAIFTLNQDTLLEQKYLQSDVREGSQGRWLGAQSPGLLEEDNAYVALGLFRPADPPYSIKERVQPYFKLHGSSHWRALNGLNLLIMAENKGTQIDGVALLDWYRSEFRARLSQPDARLMIIGYGFRDPHINEILWSSTRSGLKLFIVDVAGLRPLEEAPKITGHASTLLDELRGAIMGGSAPVLIAPRILTITRRHGHRSRFDKWHLSIRDRNSAAKALPSLAHSGFILRSLRGVSGKREFSCI